MRDEMAGIARSRVAAVALGAVLAVGCQPSSPDDGSRRGAKAESSSGAQVVGDDGQREEAAEPVEAQGSPEAVADEASGEAPSLGQGSPAQRALMAKAKAAFLEGRSERAEELFEELVDSEHVSGPRVSAAIALGQIYNETGRAERAVALYEGLADELGEVPEVQIVVARALAGQGERESAIEAYRALLDVQPDYLFALVELAALYEGAGRDEATAKTLYRYEKKVYAMAGKLGAPDVPLGEKLHVMEVFSMISDDKANEALVEALGDARPEVRARAAVVLAQVGAVEARARLEEVSKRDPQTVVRKAAAYALRELGPGGGDAQPEQVGPTFMERSGAPTPPEP